MPSWAMVCRGFFFYKGFDYELYVAHFVTELVAIIHILLLLYGYATVAIMIPIFIISIIVLITTINTIITRFYACRYFQLPRASQLGRGSAIDLCHAREPAEPLGATRFPCCELLGNEGIHVGSRV